MSRNLLHRIGRSGLTRAAGVLAGTLLTSFLWLSPVGAVTPGRIATDDPRLQRDADGEFFPSPWSGGPRTLPVGIPLLPTTPAVILTNAANIEPVAKLMQVFAARGYQRLTQLDFAVGTGNTSTAVFGFQKGGISASQCQMYIIATTKRITTPVHFSSPDGQFSGWTTGVCYATQVGGGAFVRSSQDSIIAVDDPVDSAVVVIGQQGGTALVDIPKESRIALPNAGDPGSCTTCYISWQLPYDLGSGLQGQAASWYYLTGRSGDYWRHSALHIRDYTVLAGITFTAGMVMSLMDMNIEAGASVEEYMIGRAIRNGIISASAYGVEEWYKQDVAYHPN